jgi:hypothetical protein
VCATKACCKSSFDKAERLVSVVKTSFKMISHAGN